MVIAESPFLKEGALILWCPPAPPHGTLPPAHRALVQHIHGDLVQIQVVDALGLTQSRVVPTNELYRDPRVSY
jgi:hypothetical protein